MAGPLVRWSPGPLVRWSSGPLVLVRWSPAVRWSASPLVLWSFVFLYLYIYFFIYLFFRSCSPFSFLRLLFLLFALQRRSQTRKQARKQASKQARAAHLWIWCAAGEGAVHPRHPRLPRNQYFKVNSPVQHVLTKQLCLLYLSIYLSIYVSIDPFIFLSVYLQFNTTKYYTCHESALQGPQSLAPATKSALQGPQSPAPATNSTLPHQKVPRLPRNLHSKAH